MAEVAQMLGNADEIEVEAPAAGYVSGQVVQLDDGRAGVINSLAPVDEGEVATATAAGRFRVAALSTAVFAVGALVGFDTSAAECVVTGSGDKDHDIGRAAAAKASGETTVDVVLNCYGETS